MLVARSHKFGRQGQASYDDYEAGADDYGDEGGYAGYSGGNGYEDQSSDEEEEDSEEEDEESAFLCTVRVCINSVFMDFRSER